MNIKSEIIEYFIDKLNTNIDLTDILNVDGTTYYTKTNPFQAIEFKKVDKGGLENIPQSDVIKEQKEETGKYIPVAFTGAALSRENILAIGNNPLKSWGNVVGIQFTIEIEDEEQYKKVYDKLQEFHTDFLFNFIELINFQGEVRQIDLTSPNIIDLEGSISGNNSIDRKRISTNVTVSVTNKGIVKGSRKQYVIDGEIIPLIVKGYGFDKIMVDNSNAESTTSKFVPDVATENITVNVVLDFDDPLVKKVFDEIQSKNITKLYEIKTNYILPDTSIQLLEGTYFLESYLETITELGAIVLTLKFRGA